MRDRPGQNRNEWTGFVQVLQKVGDSPTWIQIGDDLDGISGDDLFGMEVSPSFIWIDLSQSKSESSMYDFLIIYQYTERFPSARTATGSPHSPPATTWPEPTTPTTRFI